MTQKDTRTMVGENAAMEFLEVEVADAVSQCGVDVEMYERTLNRIRYRFAQCEPVRPKWHKGKYVKDFFTCGNCAFTIPEVGWKYCPNCGYSIGKRYEWD